MKLVATIMLVCIFFTTNAQTDSTQNQSRNYLSLEVDPAPFILGGYSFSIKISPAKLPHLALMGSVYGSDMPDKMIAKANYENGFRNLEINRSYAMFADYFIKSDRTGFYFGPSVFLYSKTVGNSSSTSTIKFNSIYPNLRAGYVYKPFKKSGFYINPWVNFGKEYITGQPRMEGKEFSATSLSYIAAIHLGYKITF